MPEGVEVRLSAELVKPLVVGKTTASFSLHGRYQDNDPEGLKGFKDKAKVIDVQNKGKFMYWSFENDWYMFCSFGMSGQWSPKKGKHPALGITFTDGSEIYFNDPRHFGTIKFVHGRNNLLKKLNDLGWDPLSDDLEDHFETIYNKVNNAGKPVGEVLMDQKIFAGVGNYIRAEALYLSRISPWRFSRLISREDLRLICLSVVEVMKTSYQHQGATIHTYATVYGEEGKYSSCFKVYGQDKDPFGNSIKRDTTPDGRTIHWCPAIQN